MRVPAFPTLRVQDFHSATHSPFAQIPVSSAFFFRGTGAIVQAAKIMGLTPEDEVLVPAYHCGIEVDAIRHSGARIVFVPLTARLDLTPDALRTRLSRRSKAVLLIHFFGFPQPVAEVRAFCDEHRLLLIEDCAHALFSAAGTLPLGQSGDYSVFSFQKTLPVPDGGALVGAHAKTDRANAARPSVLTTARGMALRMLSGRSSRNMLWETLTQWIVIAPARVATRLMMRWRGRGIAVSPSAVDFDPMTACMQMSGVARRIAQHANPDQIISTRRRWYQTLAKALEGTPGLEIPLKALPEGVCPLFFPLLVREREHLRAHLERCGVETFIFGEIPHRTLPSDTCAIAARWSRENLCLPTHQTLTEDMVWAMIDAVQRWPGSSLGSVAAPSHLSALSRGTSGSSTYAC